MNKIAKICAIGGLVLAAGAGAGYGIIFGAEPEAAVNSQSAVSSGEITAQAGDRQTEAVSSDSGSSVNAQTAASNEIIAKAGTQQTEIILSDSGITVNGSGAEVSGNTVTITKTGNYSVSGTLSDGQIYVNAGKDDSVVLTFNGADISNSSEAAVYIENAGNTLILLEEETENRLQSGTPVEIGETEESEDSSASGGAVHSKDDLWITGTGSLQVFGYINNGIQSSNNIVIDSGNIEVTAVNNGIKGKDSVEISGGEISIRSGGDGIKSDDTTGEGYGVIKISGGNISIESDGDGIQSETELDISGGEISVISGGGSENAFSAYGNVIFGDFGGKFENPGERSGNDDFMPENDRSGMNGFPAMPGNRNGGNGENSPDIPENGNWEKFKDGNEFGGRGGAGNKDVFGGGIWDPDDFGDFGGFGGFRGKNFDMDDNSDVSKKGIKCGGVIKISGGRITVDSYDDAIHSNDSIFITGGEFSLASGDDGIHADKELEVNDGTILVTRSYEGLEANQIRLSGGNIDVTASDDGINAYGGQNNFGGFGGSSKTTDETPMLYFLGANVVVNADGDGIDSNGSIFVEAGTIIINGPTNSGNGAIDSGSENGGECIINGGTILAIGSAGMDEGFSSESSQCSFRIRPGTAISAGSEITISDAEGNVLFSHTAVKNAGSVVFSCPELKVGEKYILSVDGQETEIKQNSISESSGGGSFGFGGAGGGNRRNRW